MQIAYVDDSGDQESFALGAVIVPADQWLVVHDQLRSFRSRLSTDVGFRMRQELKATKLVSGGGAWYSLAVPQHRRYGIYKAALQELADMAPMVRTLAVVVPNRKDPKLWDDARGDAWDVLLGRLERYCKSSSCMVIADEGAPQTLRALTRRKRRFGYAPAAFGGPPRKVPFRQFVDDPVMRESNQSYILQWADLVAYAAFRQVMTRPEVPPKLWDELATAALGEANELERLRKGSAEPPGVIVWPSRMRPGQPPASASPAAAPTPPPPPAGSSA